MKKNLFFEAMNDIDATLIERADRKVTLKSRGRTVRIAAIAACFAILVASFAVVLPMLIGGDDMIVQDSYSWNDIIKMFSPGNSDGLTVGESNVENEIVVVEFAFAEIVSADYSDYVIGSILPTGQSGSYIGEKLGEVDVRSGWYHRAEGVETDVTIVKAEVYEIGGVSSKAAVAIRYLERCAANSEYYSYIYYIAANKKYEFTTLSAFLADLNANVYMKMSDYALLMQFPNDPHEQISIHKFKFNAGAGEKIRDIILSLDGRGETVGYYDETGVSFKKGTKVLDYTFTLQTSSGKIHHLYVLENGTIAIEGVSEGVVIFNIGIDATDTLWAAFDENLELATDKYTEDDLVYATTEEVNE